MVFQKKVINLIYLKNIVRILKLLFLVIITKNLKGILDIAKEQEVANVFVHAFSDGRDCDPKSGGKFINDLQDYMKESTGELASVTGRYYAMDRDNRWERIKIAYDGLVNGVGTTTKDVVVKKVSLVVKPNGLTETFTVYVAEIKLQLVLPDVKSSNPSFNICNKPYFVCDWILNTSDPITYV